MKKNCPYGNRNIPFLLFAILLLTVSNTGYGQNRIYNDIQSAKKSKTKFHVKEIFTVLDEEYSREDVFHNLEEVHLVSLNLETKDLSNSAISFKIPLGREVVDIDLLEVPDSFHDYEVTNEKEERFFVNKNQARHYRGVIRGEANSIVAISFFDENVMGIISNEDGNYNIGKIDDSDQLIIYNDLNLIIPFNYEYGCANDNRFDDNVEPIEYVPNILLQNPRFSSAPDTNCVRFYFETEYDIYQSLGTMQAVNNYVAALYNQVALIYYNEGISTTISAIMVWTIADPYTAGATNSALLLSQFQANTGAFNGDLGHLLSFRTNANGYGSGLVASFHGLCNTTSTDNSLAVSTGLSSVVTNFPIYSWSVMVLSHEFGHLMGSLHTHACVWNGNNTAIDGCSNCQESPPPLTFSCNYCPQPPLPPAGLGGTIMSYCHLISGVGINLSNGFGLQPGNFIRHRVANVPCLASCSGCPAGTTAFDIYSQDRPLSAGTAFDTGIEPNPDTGPMWLSEDIWIRQNMDNGVKPQNAEFKQYSPNGVYVKVRNLSTVAYSECAELKVYFSKASTGLTWPTHFYDYFQNVGTNSVLHGDIIGTAIVPQIPPNGSVTIEIPWYPPNPNDYTNDKHHFCLLSRILSLNDPMANEVATWVGSNVKNNNNIAWKNISVRNTNIANSPPPPAISVFTRGIDEVSEFTDLRFVDEGFGEEIEQRFFDMGKIDVELEPELFQRMLENGSLEGEGIEIIDENKVQVFMREAVFRNVPIGFNETFYMKFDFQLFEELEVGEEITLDVVQENPETGKLEGGERFLIVNEEINEEEGRAEAPAVSFEITPNPNSGIFTIEHDDIETGSYLVYDIYGNVILNGNISDQKEIIIDITGEKAGMYFINLISEKFNLSKTLIKR